MEPRILAIIDDETEMEDIYSLILEPLLERGLFEIKFFSDSRLFLKWFESTSEQNTPDLVFCDINMPYMDGIALCRKLRQSGRPMEIALISGDSKREHVESMKELAIRHYISKPVSPIEVLNLCEEQFEPLQASL